MRPFIVFIGIFLIFKTTVFSQEKAKAKLTGEVIDKQSKEPLIGATVFVVGSYLSAATDLSGRYTIDGIKPGDYSIKISYVGYADKQYNGLRFTAGETKILDVTLTEAQLSLGEVEVVGEKSLIDLENGRTTFKISADEISQMNARDVQQVAALQPGVNQTPDGLQIRGGRVYETAYLIDGISASDPLAGNAMGAGLSAGSIQELNVVTGSAGAEYADAVSGVVSARVKEGGDKLKVGASWITDNQNKLFNSRWGWNTDIVNAYIGGPVIREKLNYFTSFDFQLSDDYTVYPNGDAVPTGTLYRAKQLKSSLFDDPNEPNDMVWSRRLAPRQDNKWTHTLKLNYNIKKGMKVTVTNQHSIMINQNTRTLLVQGFGNVLEPGFQYNFSQNMDNATTYSHRTNLTAVNFKWLFTQGWSYDATIGRLFTNMRADANGRPFRPNTIDQVYDPKSIVTEPVTVFNPNGDIVFVNPGPGLVNNNGISTVWHDHYVQEYSMHHRFLRSSKNKNNFMTMGWQHKEQDMQWADVTSPWVGAPIRINDTLSTLSTSVGSRSDLWRVQPASGALYWTDEIRYKGIVATFGLRFSYWALGKYVDDAIVNPKAPLTDAIRNQYTAQTLDIGRRYNARLLPNVEVKFPVTDNNVLFFNYAQSMRNEHPLFFYQGLNPVYANNAYLGDIGNPALRPSIVATYEMGTKSQVTKNTALSLTAYYKDVFDYAKRATMEVQDFTGQVVLKQTYINQDYARVRGLEGVYNQRLYTYLQTIWSVTYQVATGKSNTAYESALQIRQQGFTNANKEIYMAWDTPLESKLTVLFSTDSSWRVGFIPLRNIKIFWSATYRSNQRRYTRQDLIGFTDYGRPIYVDNQTTPFTELSESLFWADIKVTRDFQWAKGGLVSVFIEFKNMFNSKNAQIINPVTGRAYEYGQPLPIDNRDPVYQTPQDNGTPPFNPARYMQPIQFLTGVTLRY